MQHVAQLVVTISAWMCPRKTTFAPFAGRLWVTSLQLVCWSWQKHPEGRKKLDEQRQKKKTVPVGADAAIHETQETELEMDLNRTAPIRTVQWKTLQQNARRPKDALNRLNLVLPLQSLPIKNANPRKD